VKFISERILKKALIITTERAPIIGNRQQTHLTF